MLQTNLLHISNLTPSQTKLPSTHGRFCPPPHPNVSSQVTPIYEYMQT